MDNQYLASLLDQYNKIKANDPYGLRQPEDVQPSIEAGNPEAIVLPKDAPQLPPSVQEATVSPSSAPVVKGTNSSSADDLFTKNASEMPDLSLPGKPRDPANDPAYQAILARINASRKEPLRSFMAPSGKSNEDLALSEYNDLQNYQDNPDQYSNFESSRFKKLLASLGTPAAPSSDKPSDKASSDASTDGPYGPQPLVGPQNDPNAKASDDSDDSDDDDAKPAAKGSKGAVAKASSGSDKSNSPVVPTSSSAFDPNIAMLSMMGNRNSAVLMNQLGKAGQTAGEAIAGVKPTSTESYDQNIKMAGQGLADFQAVQDNQKHNPNSEVSKTYRAFLTKMGMNVGDNASAADLEKAFPVVERYLANKDSAEARKMHYANAAADREAIMKLKMDDKHRADDEKEAAKMSEKINALSQTSRSAIGRAGGAKISVNRLLDIVADPNASAQDMSSVAADLNNVVSGSTTISGSAHQEYNNLATDFAKGVSYILSNSHAPNVPDVKAHIADVAKRMNKISDSVINQHAQIVASGHQGWIKRHQDEWNNMLQKATSIGNTDGPSSAGSVDTAAAKKWVSEALAKNPNDPDALSVKQRLKDMGAL